MHLSFWTLFWPNTFISIWNLIRVVNSIWFYRMNIHARLLRCMLWIGHFQKLALNDRIQMIKSQNLEKPICQFGHCFPDQGTPGNTGTFPTGSWRTSFLFRQPPGCMSCHSLFHSFGETCTCVTNHKAAVSFFFPGSHQARICTLAETKMYE